MTLIHPQKATTSWQCERYWRLHSYGHPRDGYRLSLHKRETRFEWRWTGPERVREALDWGSGSVEPSPELATLLVLLIGGQVPVGVACDMLDEQQPGMARWTALLRQWDEHNRYATVTDPIAERGRT